MKIKTQNKLTLLDAIQHRKSVLFGNFKTTSNDEKVESWKNVHNIAQALQLATSDRSWQFIRNKLYGLWKCRTLVSTYLFFFFLLLLWHLVFFKSFGRHHNISLFFTVLNYFPPFLCSQSFKVFFHNIQPPFLEVSFPLVSNLGLSYLYYPRFSASHVLTIGSFALL